MSTPEQLLEGIANELVRMNGTLEHLLAQQASGSVSSVQLEQDSKGQVKLTVKVYAGSDCQWAADEALAEFGRLFRKVDEAQRRQWSDTLDAVSAERNGA